MSIEANHTAAESSPSLIDPAAEQTTPVASRHPAEVEYPPGGRAPETAQDARAPRPDFIGDEFWDGAKGEVRLEALAKSQRDLRRQISKGDHKPPARPEDYRLPMPEAMPAPLAAVLTQGDDPLLAGVQQAALESGVSQQQFEAMARPFLANLARHAANAPRQASGTELQKAEQEYLKGELAKLGPTGDEQVRAIGTWGSGLLHKGMLTKEEFAEFRYAAGSAAGLRLLAKLRDLGAERPVPIEAGAGEDQGALEDYYRLVASGTPEDRRKAKRVLESLDRAGMLPNRPPPGVGLPR